MSSLRILLAARGGAGEARLLRRLTKIWLATGTVPVVHMVADSDDTADAAPLALRPATNRARRPFGAEYSPSPTELSGPVDHTSHGPAIITLPSAT
jgi:hypothetical protein